VRGKPKPLNDILEDCPNCGSIWGSDEIGLGRCFACGYVEGDNPNYEDDDNYEEEFYQMNTTNIEVNGQDIQINGDTLSYEQIVKFAHLNESLNPSVVYKHSGGKNTDDILCRGESVTLKDGTTISVFVTGNS